MPRAVLSTVLLALVLSTLTLVSPTATQARVTREVSMRPDTVTGSITATRVVRLDRPAASAVAYWKGNPEARVTLALSKDGCSFGAPEPAGRDEIGGQRHDGTT